MKTQLTKSSRTKARYTEEYKQEALELWRASAAVATVCGSNSRSGYRQRYCELNELHLTPM
jgi:hypothetical protein